MPNEPLSIRASSLGGFDVEIGGVAIHRYFTHKRTLTHLFNNLSKKYDIYRVRSSMGYHLNHIKLGYLDENLAGGVVQGSEVGGEGGAALEVSLDGLLEAVSGEIVVLNYEKKIMLVK